MENVDKKFQPERDPVEKPKRNVREFINQKVIPFMGKVGNQTHLSALRDAFGTMVPLLVAGSMGLLLGFIVFGSGGTGKISLLGLICKVSTGWSWEAINDFGGAATGWAKVSQIGGAMFSVLSEVTIGAMSIYFVWLFGYFIAIARKAPQPIMVGFISLGTFWIVNMGEITWSMGAQGLLSGIIFGIASSELFIFLGKFEKLKVKLPDGVPPAIGKSFSMLVSIILTLGAAAVANVVVLAPAIASTGWAVTSQQSVEIGTDVFSQAWNNKEIPFADLISKAEWAPYKDILLELQSKWGQVSYDEYIKWFESLSNQDKSIISTFSLIEIFGQVNANDLEFLNKFANSRMVIINDEIMSVFSYQGIVIGSNKFGLGQAIFKFFSSWFIGMAMSDAGLALAIICVFFGQLFWFFGVHGTNVMAAIFDPIFFMITAINIALYSSMGMSAAIATGEMGYWGANWSKWFVDIGGSGGTLSLIVATFIFSRRREYKELSKYAVSPGLFGINEPVIFGWPLVLNGIYAIPFIVGPLLSVFPYYIFGPVLKIINPPVIILPWTTPSILGAVLANLDWKSIIPFFIGFAIQFVLWIPVIFIDNAHNFKKLKISDPEKYELEMRYLKDKDYRNSVKEELRVKKLARKEKLKARKMAAKEKKQKELDEKKVKNS